MSIRLIRLWILFTCCAMLLGGCWSRRELNSLAIAAGMAIDKKEEGYLITVQVVNPESPQVLGSSGSRSAGTTYGAIGPSVFEALRKMTTIAPRKIYLSHLRILILGEDLVKEGIGDALELVSRDHEFRTDFYITLARDRPAADMLKVSTTMERTPAQSLYDSLAISEKAWAPTHGVTLDELVSSMTGEGRSAVLTGITIMGPFKKSLSKDNTLIIDSPLRLKYSEMAVLKEDKLVGWMNESESKGYNYITDNVTSTVGSVHVPGKGSFVVEVFRSKPHIQASVRNGKPEFHIRINGEANIGEMKFPMDLTKVENIRLLENVTDQRNQKLVHMAVRKAQKLKADVFGFGTVLHRTDPVYWKKVEKDWPNLFAEARVTVSSEFKIRKTGTVNNSYLNELKKE